jgi:uncharacterized protein (TIGR02646 family)
MMPMVRGPKPQALAARAERWTTSWVEKAERGRKFQWPTWKGQPLNDVLEVSLAEMTGGHCAYCDHFPLDVEARSTIDHHRPKATGLFPHLAFEWSNLFYCCSFCNGTKGEQWHDALLKPDEPGFAFERYFDIDVMSGEVRASPAATPHDRHRAEESIRIFGLNEGNRPLSRRTWARKGPAPGQPYRFLA